MSGRAPRRLFACISVRTRVAFCLFSALLLVQTAAALPSAVPVNSVGTAVPILMYHSVLKDASRAGQYIVTTQTLESDLRYLREHGCTAMFASELADAVLTGKLLPAKPVIITFDDGYLNNLTYALPLLEEYDMKAVVSVMGRFIEQATERQDPNPTYAYLTWDDITTLLDSGRVEIANHSYDMHRQYPRKGILQMRGEPDADYYQNLVEDIGKTQSLLEEHCGVLPTTFAFPYGHNNCEAQAILQEMGFTAQLTCYEHINYVASDVEVLLTLGRFNRANKMSTAKFMKKLGIN